MFCQTLEFNYYKTKVKNNNNITFLYVLSYKVTKKKIKLF